METKIKKYITSLLTSTPLVMTIQQLDKDYRNTIGEAIPYQKLGYNTLEHFLTCIPDTIQVRGAGPKAQVIPVFSEKSAHVNELVTSQKVVNKKKGYVPVQRRVRTFLPLGYNQNVNNTGKPVVSMPPKKMYYPKQKEAPPPSKCPSQPIDNCISRSESNDLPNHSEFDSVDKKLPSLNSIFQNSALKQTNLLGGVKKLEDTNRLEESKPSNSTAYVASDSKWANNPKKFMRDLDKISAKQFEDSVPIQVRNNLRALIRQCPEGIWCAEIPEKYRKMFRCKLDYQELGFKSLIHLCVSLSSIFHYARPSTEDYRLYDRSRPLPDCAEKTFTMASYGTNSNKVSSEVDLNNALPNIDWVDAKRFLPPDIFPLGEEIPRMFIAHDVKENDNIDIMVGEIYDLSKFWVYMADSRLDRLMDELQEFYKEKAQQYFIPDHLIMEGMYCVQIIFGEYHRALIVDTMPELEETIKVIFIDYGTMTKVSTKGLCFLHGKFSELEAQAIRCRLADVIPLHEEAPWSREACKAFRKMVVGRDMLAKINKINWEEKYLEIYLADVTNEDDIFYINDRLIEEGFAQLPNKARADPIVNPLYTPIAKLIHLFPTFLELEHGLAPSTAEMEIFHECDIPINFCYPQYFYTDYTREQAVIDAAERFHESYCVKGKRRSPSAQHFDLDYIKDLMLDLSVFGDLQWEIEEFMKSSVKKDSSFNDEDFVDADEAHFEESCSSDLNLLTKQLGELSTREEEAVEVLRRDLMMAEDIIKDISKICNIEPSGNNSQENRKFCSFDRSQSGELRSDFHLLKSEWPNSETYWMRNENKISTDAVNCTVIKKESFNTSDDVGTHVELPNHPLSAMVFDLPSEEENGSEFSGYERNLRLSSEDYPLSIENQTKIQHKNSSIPEDELFINAESIERKKTVVMNTSTAQVKIENCTNPFLLDVAAMTDTKVDLIKLNPNNPFLTYQREDDKSSEGSSASTAYESPVMATAQHSWTTFSDMSAETISLLGKSLCSKSSSTDSLRTCGPSCSIQTLDKQDQAIQVVECTQRDYFPPPTSSVPYCHPPWWANQSNNPYYSVHYANVQSYTCDAQYGPRPPVVPPPPGFLPQNRFPPVQSFQPVPQYAPQRPLCYYPGQRVPNIAMPPFQPTFNPTNTHCTNVSSSANSRPAPVAFDHVGAVRKSRDFYDVYNEELRQRMNLNQDQ